MNLPSNLNSELIGLLQDRDEIVGFKSSKEIRAEKQIKLENKKTESELDGLLKKELGKDSAAPASTPNNALKYLDYLQARTSILGVRSKDKNILGNITEVKREIVQKALKTIHERVSCQIVSLFSFCKDGSLERIGLYGFDIHGNLLDNSSISPEKHGIGEGFLGKFVQPKSEKEMSFIYIEEAFSQVLKNFKFKAEYSKKIDTRAAVAAFPINGRNKTYAVLLAVAAEDGFSDKSIEHLSALSNYTATALSNFRRDVQTESLRILSNLLILPAENNESALQRIKDRKSVFQRVSDLLVQNPETAFKACIIRVLSDVDSKYHVRAISLWEGVDEFRDNRAINGSGIGLAETVIRTGKRVILQNIRDPRNLDRFKNSEWIITNSLDSFGCFPLISRGKILGTVSLYVGFNYHFHPDSIEHVQSIANLIAAFVDRNRYESRKPESISTYQSGEARLRGNVHRDSTYYKEYGSGIRKKNTRKHSYISDAMLRIVFLSCLCFLALQVLERPGIELPQGFNYMATLILFFYILIELLILVLQNFILTAGVRHK